MRALIALLLATLPAAAQQTFPTYAAGFYNLGAQAAATDVVCLENAGHKVIRLMAVTLAGIGVAAGTIHVSVLIRSTANAGGVSITPAPVPLSSDYPPGTAVLRAYTANPTTLGTSIGVIREDRWDITTQGSNADPGNSLGLLPVYNPPAAKMTLKGTGSDPAAFAGCLSFNGTGPASTLTGDATWTEEAQ